MPPCLTLSIIRYRSSVKWSNPEKEVAPSPTPWCSSDGRGTFGSPSTRVANLTDLKGKLSIQTSYTKKKKFKKKKILGTC